MASDEFRHTTKQKPPDAPLSMRTNDDEVGAPSGRSIEDGLSDVAYLDRSLSFEPRAAQFLCNSLDQIVGCFFLALQLRSVGGVHLRGSWADWL